MGKGEQRRRQQRGRGRSGGGGAGWICHRRPANNYGLPRLGRREGRHDLSDIAGDAGKRRPR
jgi:hypothetical protein